MQKANNSVNLFYGRKRVPSWISKTVAPKSALAFLNPVTYVTIEINMINNYAIQALSQSQRILVAGTGLSSSIAVFLAHSLKIIGLDARLSSNEGLSLASDIAGLRQGDMLIAIDLRRYLRSTVSAVRKARSAGAQVIANTDSIVSPLVESADFAFEVVT